MNVLEVVKDIEDRARNTGELSRKDFAWMIGIIRSMKYYLNLEDEKILERAKNEEQNYAND